MLTKIHLQKIKDCQESILDLVANSQWGILSVQDQQEIFYTARKNTYIKTIRYIDEHNREKSIEINNNNWELIQDTFDEFEENEFYEGELFAQALPPENLENDIVPDKYQYLKAEKIDKEKTLVLAENLIKRLSYGFNYELKLDLENIYYSDHIKEIPALTRSKLINELLDALRIYPDKYYNIGSNKIDSENKEKLRFFLKRDIFDQYSIHYYMLCIIDKSSKNLDVLDNTVSIKQKLIIFIKNSEDLIIKKTAVSTLISIVKNHDLTASDKEEITDFLLDELYLCKNEEWEKILVELLGDFSISLELEEINEIIKHIILQFKNNDKIYNAPRTALYKLMMGLSIEKKEFLIINNLKFLWNESYKIKRGMVTFFWDMDCSEISKKTLDAVIEAFCRDVFIPDENQEASELAINCLAKFYDSNHADELLKEKIIDILMDRLIAGKSFSASHAILDCLVFGVMDNVDKIINLSLDKYIISQSADKTKKILSVLFDFYAEISTCFEAKILLDKIIKAKPTETMLDSQDNRIDLYVKNINKNVNKELRVESPFSPEDYLEDTNFLIEYLQDIDLIEKTKRNKMIGDLISNIGCDMVSTIHNQSDPGEIIYNCLNYLKNSPEAKVRRKAAYALILFLAKSMDRKYVNEILGALKKSSHEDKEEDVRAYIASQIIYTRDPINVFYGLKILILKDASIKVQDVAQKSLRKILYTLLMNNHIPIELIISLGELKFQENNIETISQAIRFFVILLRKKNISYDYKTAILNALINIALTADNLLILSKVIYELNLLNDFVPSNLIQDIKNKIIEASKNVKWGVARAYALQRNPEGYTQAISEYTRYIENEPNNHLVLFELGMVYLFSNEVNAAIEKFTQVISLNDNFYLVYIFRAYTLIASQSYDQAMENLNLAITLNSDFSLIYHLKAIIYERKGKLDLALDEISIAIDMFPHLLNALNKRIELYYRNQNFKLAKIDEQTIEKIDPAYQGLTKQKTLELAALGEEKMLVGYYPKKIKIDQLYQWLKDTNFQLSTTFFDELMAKIKDLFSDDLVDRYAEKKNFSSKNLQKLTRYSHELVRFVKNFIEYILIQEVWEAYHKNYKLIIDKEENNVNLIKLVNESKINDIFLEDNIPILVEKLQDKLQIYTIYEFLKKYVGTIDLQDGYALGISTDLGMTYEILHKIFGLYHYESVYAKNDLDGTADLFECILKEQKPIIFFVPTDLGSNPKGITYEEMSWINTALKSGVNLKQIILVFDSYNFLPFHIFNIKTEEDKPQADANASLTSVLKYLEDYIIADKDKPIYLDVLKKNVHDSVKRNLSGYIYYDLREAIANAEFDKDEDFLNELQSIIDKFFDFKIISSSEINLVGFYDEIDRVFPKDMHKKQSKINLSVFLFWLCKLFSNDLCAPYINPAHQYDQTLKKYLQDARETGFYMNNFLDSKAVIEECEKMLDGNVPEKNTESLNNLLVVGAQDFDSLIIEGQQKILEDSRGIKKIVEKNNQAYTEKRSLTYNHHDAMANGNCVFNVLALSFIYNKQHGVDLFTVHDEFRQVFAKAFNIDAITFTQDVFSKLMDALVSPQINLENNLIKKILRKLENVGAVQEGVEINQLDFNIKRLCHSMMSTDAFEDSGAIKSEYYKAAICCLAARGVLLQLVMSIVFRAYCVTHKGEEIETVYQTEDRLEFCLIEKLNTSPKFGSYLSGVELNFLAKIFGLEVTEFIEQMGVEQTYGEGEIKLQVSVMRPGMIDCHYELLLPKTERFLDNILLIDVAFAPVSSPVPNLLMEYRHEVPLIAQPYQICFGL